MFDTSLPLPPDLEKYIPAEIAGPGATSIDGILVRVNCTLWLIMQHFY